MDGILEQMLVLLGVKGDDDILDAAEAVDGLFDAVAATTVAAVTLTAKLGMLGVEVAREVVHANALASALGMSVEEYYATTDALDVLGVEADDTADAIATISDRAEDALGGVKSMREDFKLLGVSMDDLRDKTPLERLWAMFDAYEENGTAAKRLAAVVRLLGDDLGRRFFRALELGGDGVKEMAAALMDLQGTIDEDAVASAERLGIKLGLLDKLGEALRRRIGLSLVPAIERMVDRLWDAYDVNREFIDQRLDLVLDGLVWAFDQLTGPAGAVVGIMAAWAALRTGKNILQMVGAMGPLGAGMVRAAAASKAALVAFGPWGVVLLAAALLWEEFTAAAEGGDGVLTRLADSAGVGSEFREAMVAMVDMLGAARDAMGALGEWVYAGMIEPLGEALPIVKEVVDALASLVDFDLSDVREGLRGFLSGAAERFTTAAGGFRNAAPQVRQAAQFQREQFQRGQQRSQDRIDGARQTLAAGYLDDAVVASRYNAAGSVPSGAGGGTTYVEQNYGGPVSLTVQADGLTEEQAARVAKQAVSELTESASAGRSGGAR